jgi:hypothetical protein
MQTVEYIQDTPGTIRIRRCGLLRSNPGDVDRLCIKVADSQNELEQAFALVYREYLRQGYIKDPKESGLHFDIHHILPETAVFILKSSSVISTLTHILDSKLFGLPMDDLYCKELKPLRNANRKLAELSSLATFREACGQNLFLYLFREVYWYARARNVDDFCIMVNPKHVKFYQEIFFFEEIGPKKYYPKVGAPAVALRLNLEEFDEKLEKEYSRFEPDCNMHAFVHSVNDHKLPNGPSNGHFWARLLLNIVLLRNFLKDKSSVLGETTVKQTEYLRHLYPTLQ